MPRKMSYDEEEELLADAIQYKRDHPQASFRFLERQFKVNKDKICRRFHGRGSRFGQASGKTRLTPEQDKALCWFLDYLDKFGIPLRYKSLLSAANHILTISDPDAKPVSKNWPRRWIASHPGYKVRKEKPIEQARQQAMNVIDTRRFYRELEEIIEEYDIQREDFWNMDEMGIRTGVGRGQWVIIPDDPEDEKSKGRFSTIIGSHGDQEHVTVVEAISAGGIAIPPLIIVKGKVILVKWFADILDDDYLIGVSESGYANDVLFFQRLQHWEAMSRRTQKGDYRLLLLDGYDSHLTYTALKFCEMQNVVVVLLPPHTTHFLQPLDVAVFQQWKHYHAQVIDRSVRQGIGNLDKSHFFAYIEEIRTFTLTRRNVKSGFRKCGYWPFRPEGVLQQLAVDGAILEEVEQEEGRRSATPPQSPQSPQSTALEPIWSSPIAHEKLVMQADAIQDFFRSSAEPQSPSTMARFRVNLEKFLSTIKAKDILQESLTRYIWNSSIAKGKEDRRKSRRGTRVQKGGVVYAGDVERDISNMEPFLKKLGDELSVPQQIFAVRLRTMVNDQFMRNALAKRMREIADGKLKLRPEHPNATVVCKLGWTEWTTKGMGRGKAPRKKNQKRARPERQSEEESNSENSREFEGTPCPDGNNNSNPPPILPNTRSNQSRKKQGKQSSSSRSGRS